MARVSGTSVTKAVSPWSGRFKCVPVLADDSVDLAKDRTYAIGPPLPRDFVLRIQLIFGVEQNVGIDQDHRDSSPSICAKSS